MQNLVLSLFMDFLMAGLLLATMVYCWRLNKRIQVLQDSRSELAMIIREFDESTQRATQSIAEIHKATSRLSENIQHKIDKANFLADDLEIMISRGQKLVGKAESTASSPVRQAPVQSPPPLARGASVGGAEKVASAFLMSDEAEMDAAPARDVRARSRAEQEIMSALGAKPKPFGE